MKEIIEGKLYDTETAEEVISYIKHRIFGSDTYQMFRTRKDSYFSIKFTMKIKKYLVSKL